MRDFAHRNVRNRPGEPLPVKNDRYFDSSIYADYLDWRAQKPSDDLITDLLHVEFTDATGEERQLSRDELLTFLVVIAGAGVDTTGRLFGWMGAVLGEHADQRRALVHDRSLVGNAVEELLRFEPPGPHVAP